MLPRTFSKQRRYIVCLRTFLFIYFILFAFSVSLSLLPNFFSFSSLSHQRPQLLVIEYLIKGKREKHFNPFDLAFCLRFLFFFTAHLYFFSTSVFHFLFLCSVFLYHLHFCFRICFSVRVMYWMYVLIRVLFHRAYKNKEQVFHVFKCVLALP